jgi:hypothetical protein
VAVRWSMRRQTLVNYVTKLPACMFAIEASCGVHHLGRMFAAQGHEIRLMSPVRVPAVACHLLMTKVIFCRELRFRSASPPIGDVWQSLGLSRHRFARFLKSATRQIGFEYRGQECHDRKVDNLDFGLGA